MENIIKDRQKDIDDFLHFYPNITAKSAKEACRALVSHLLYALERYCVKVPKWESGDDGGEYAMSHPMMLIGSIETKNPGCAVHFVPANRISLFVESVLAGYACAKSFSLRLWEDGGMTVSVHVPDTLPGPGASRATRLFGAAVNHHTNGKRAFMNDTYQNEFVELMQLVDDTDDSERLCHTTSALLALCAKSLGHLNNDESYQCDSNHVAERMEGLAVSGDL